MVAAFIFFGIKHIPLHQEKNGTVSKVELAKHGKTGLFQNMLFPFIFRACPFFLPLLASVSKEKLGAGTLAHRKSQLSKA